MAQAEKSEDATSICYLVRHGQRLDAVSRSDPWFKKNPHRYPLDPPLTERGSDMAKESAKAFVEAHPMIKSELKCVYASPLHRAFMTAYEFAKALDLPLVIIPGLACTEAQKVYGPIVKKPDGTMALAEKIKLRHGEIENVFLTLEEIKAYCPEVEVSLNEELMGGRALSNFEDILYELSSDSNPILVVAHREGIYHACDQLQKEKKKAYYCQTVRIDLDPSKKKLLDLNIEFKGLPNMW